MSTLIKDLGAVSAYAYAVEKGYTGTEDEFASLMYDYTDVIQIASEARDGAVAANASAQEAKTEAQAASNTANEAANKATSKASEASASVTEAGKATNAAVAAKTAAETAQQRAETAQQASEDAQRKAEIAKNEAQENATIANNKASKASQYATTATNKASEASTSAKNAKTYSEQAQASATTANTKADEASASANSAKLSADNAQQSATNAQTYMNSSSTSASKAHANAEKTQSDKEAVESAKSDVLSAVDNAQNYANSAQSASQAIQNMNVKATTLEPDSDATVEKTVDAISGAVTLTYGIPKGQVVWIDTDEEGSDIYEPINELKKDVESLNEKISILANRGSSWEEIRQNVKMGYGETLYPVGTDLEVECTENSPYTSIVFTVVDHSVIDNEPCMTLLMKSGINGLQFEHEQALIVPTETLVAGTYHFNFPDNYDASHDGTKTVQFTLVNDVQANDQIMIQYPNNQSWIGKNLTVYSNFTDTVLETCVMSEGEDGTDLGVADGSGIINHITRARYGANNWKESAMRQWLNTDALVNKWQTQQNRYQRPCTYLTKQNGFMSWFNSDFVGVIKETNHLNRTNRVYDSLGVKTPYSTNDKFFLLSQEEVGFNSEDDIICGTCFDYYVDAENIDRIKYDINNSATARWWWLRTPYPSYAYYERTVHINGSLHYTVGYLGNAVVSACTI